MLKTVPDRSTRGRQFAILTLSLGMIPKHVPLVFSNLTSVDATQRGRSLGRECVRTPHQENELTLPGKAGRRLCVAPISGPECPDAHEFDGRPVAASGYG